MAMRIPTPGAVQADTSVLTPARNNTGAISPELAAMPGRQLQQAGNAMISAGSAAASILTNMQNEVNQTFVIDGLNKLRQHAQDYKLDPNEGFLTLKGSSALDRPDGVSLPEEYGGKLQAAADRIAQSLGNDQQRQQFAMRANDVLTTFRADAQQHTLREYQNFNLSVQDGTVKLATDDAERYWYDPLRIDTAVSDASAAVVRAGKLRGESANEIEAKLKETTSRIHSGVISSSLQEGNPMYANLYLQRYKSGMTANDILKATGVLNRSLDSATAQISVKNTSDHFAPRFMPTERDRLRSIVLGLESGGKGDLNQDGTPLTSPKGAKYSMQVMPDTAKNPGYGIRPAADDSPAEYNRVGREKLDKMIERYGNVPQALAAYNAGEGRVDEAMKKAAKSQQLAANDPAVKTIGWQSFLPQETQQYVKNGMAKFSSGAGMDAQPTEAEWVQHAVGQLGPGARPEAVKLTQAAAEHQYKLFTGAVKQRHEQASTEAMRAIEGNGGSFYDLPENVRAAVAPKDVPALIDYAKKISKGDDSTSLWLYNKLASNPDGLARMSDDQFYALRKELSESDFKHFSNERAKRTGAAGTSGGPGDLNTPAITQTLNGHLRVFGMDPTPKDDGGKDAARIGAIRQFVDRYFTAAQREAGKKFTDAEVTQHVDALFARNTTFRGMFSNSSGPMLSMKVGDIPSTERDKIKAAFKRRGNDNPTDAQLLDTYWSRQMVSAK